MIRLRDTAAFLMLLPLIGVAAADPLDAADEAFRAASYGRAWAGPLGQAQRWSNPASGHGGMVLATKERSDPTTGQPCREVTETLTADGPPLTSYAVGCRRTDGGWQVVQTSVAANAEGSQSVVPADVTPYQAPPDISADGSAPNSDLSGLPAQVRIYVPWRGAPGTLPPAPR